MAQQIIVTYPPDHDGELHIVVETKTHVKSGRMTYEYSFKHAAQDDTKTAWKTLVIAAKAIIAQDFRNRNKVY